MQGDWPPGHALKRTGAGTRLRLRSMLASARRRNEQSPQDGAQLHHWAHNCLRSARFHGACRCAKPETIINAIVTSPRVMRQMPQLLREARLELDASF